MTTSENEPQPLMDPLLGAILTANVNWSNDLSDRVIENKDREIAEWKSRFLKLWERIEKENFDVDSLRMWVILEDFSYFAGIAAQDLDTK